MIGSKFDGAADVRPAPVDAVYTLFRAGDWPGRDSVVVLRRVVAGEVVGFERGADGTRVAVAGEFRKVLPEGRYRWEVVAPVTRDVADRLDARLTGAGKVYMAGLEPVGHAISAAVLAPVMLFLTVFRIPLPFS